MLGQHAQKDDHTSTQRHGRSHRALSSTPKVHPRSPSGQTLGRCYGLPVSHQVYHSSTRRVAAHRCVAMPWTRLCYSAVDGAPVSFRRRNLPLAFVPLPGSSEFTQRAAHLGSRRDPRSASDKTQTPPSSRNLGRLHTKLAQNAQPLGSGRRPCAGCFLEFLRGQLRPQTAANKSKSLLDFN